VIFRSGDFLQAPWVEKDAGSQGQIHVDALASDSLRHLGGPPLTLNASRTLRSAFNPAQVAALRLSALSCWLLHDPWFAGHDELVKPARVLLLEGLRGLAEVVKPEDCVTDPDSREELVRLVLLRLGLHPLGESPTAARDRLTALDSAERLRVAKAALEAERRAREIREAAARAAAEAASYYGRE
jgi:hypothetical protein